jgi:cytochrome c-type biogenesis protein
VIEATLVYAFTAGMVATVNPCGFPMLPAYLSYFIGTDTDEPSASRVPRALAAAAAVSLGLLAVFAALGIPINAGLTSIYRWMPWLTIVVGTLLAVLGAAMLLGFRPSLALPKLDRGGTTRQLRSMVLFGVSYAIASLSCTMPVFLIAVAGAATRSNTATGLLAFVAYGLGMSLVLMALSVALALARESFVRRLRGFLPYVDRVAGGLLVVVGGYLVYYGLWSRAVTSGPVGSAGPVQSIERLSADLTAWLGEGGVQLGGVLAAVVLVGATSAVLARRRSRRPAPAPGGTGEAPVPQPNP